MGIRILEGIESGDSNSMKCLYCSTTMWAFGGLFYEDENPQQFLEWLSGDPRILPDNIIESKMSEWRDVQEQAKQNVAEREVDDGDWLGD